MSFFSKSSPQPANRAEQGPSPEHIEELLAVFGFSAEQMRAIVGAIETSDQLIKLYDALRCARLEELGQLFQRACESRAGGSGLGSDFAWLIYQCQAAVGADPLHPIFADFKDELIRYTAGLDQMLRAVCLVAPAPNSWYIRLAGDAVSLECWRNNVKSELTHTPEPDETAFWIYFADRLLHDELRCIPSDDYNQQSRRFPSDLVSIIKFAEALRRKRVPPKKESSEGVAETCSPDVSAPAAAIERSEAGRIAYESWARQ